MQIYGLSLPDLTIQTLQQMNEWPGLREEHNFCHVFCSSSRSPFPCGTTSSITSRCAEFRISRTWSTPPPLATPALPVPPGHQTLQTLRPPPGLPPPSLPPGCTCPRRSELSTQIERWKTYWPLGRLCVSIAEHPLHIRCTVYLHVSSNGDSVRARSANNAASWDEVCTHAALGRPGRPLKWGARLVHWAKAKKARSCAKRVNLQGWCLTPTSHPMPPFRCTVTLGRSRVLAASPCYEVLHCANND